MLTTLLFCINFSVAQIINQWQLVETINPDGDRFFRDAYPAFLTFSNDSTVYYNGSKAKYSLANRTLFLEEPAGRGDRLHFQRFPLRYICGSNKVTLNDTLIIKNQEWDFTFLFIPMDLNLTGCWKVEKLYKYDKLFETYDDNIIFTFEKSEKTLPRYNGELVIYIDSRCSIAKFFTTTNKLLIQEIGSGLKEHKKLRRFLINEYLWYVIDGDRLFLSNDLMILELVKLNEPIQAKGTQ